MDAADEHVDSQIIGRRDGLEDAESLGHLIRVRAGVVSPWLLSFGVAAAPLVTYHAASYTMHFAGVTAVLVARTAVFALAQRPGDEDPAFGLSAYVLLAGLPPAGTFLDPRLEGSEREALWAHMLPTTRL